jgi:hypothetical protein
MNFHDELSIYFLTTRGDRRILKIMPLVLSGGELPVGFSVFKNHFFNNP